MISDTETKVTYTGDGKTTTFPFNFPYNEKANIYVSIYDSDTEEATILTSDYYVDDAAVLYPGYAPGSKPVASAQPAVLKSTQTLTIYRDTDVDQLVDLGEKYPLPYIENMVDKVTMILQEQKEELDRSVKVDIGDPETPEERYLELKTYINEAAESAAQSAANAEAAKATLAQTEATAKEYLAQTEAAMEDAKESEAAAQNVLTTVIQKTGEAENTVAAIAAYSVPAWDADTEYSYPAVVSYIDGNTYRCIGENVAAGTIPLGSQYWVRITTRGGDDYFYIDMQGNFVPSLYPTCSVMWELNDRGDIVPRGDEAEMTVLAETISEQAAQAAQAAAASAATSEANAATSETNAAASEEAANTSAASAEASATSAAESATSAKDSATSAATSETAAATSATNAATSETNAASSATSAAESATAAASSKTAAATSATNAAASATNAATSAANAVTSEENAASSATSAAESAVEAQDSQPFEVINDTITPKAST